MIGYIYYEAPKNEQNFSTLVEMINAMEVRAVSYTHLDVYKRQVERTRKNAASWLDSAVLTPLKRVANDEMHMKAYAVLREEFLLGVPGSVQQLKDFKKSVTGRVIPKSERDRLEIFERMLSGMQTQEPVSYTHLDVYKRQV